MSVDNQYLLGIDVGTQGLRVGIFDVQGKPVSYASQSYTTHFPQNGWAEQNPLDWWKAARSCCGKALAEAGIAKEQIAGISIDSFSCTVLPVDAKGNPLDNALIWMDIRAVKEAAEITSTGHPVLKYAGDILSPEWMIPKALWLKRNKPSIYLQADKIIECTDWLTFKLTGLWTASLNHISSKWNYVKSEGGWPISLLEEIKMPEILEKWPTDIKRLGDYVGELNWEAAAELGLNPGTPVAQGGIDAHLGMLGLGAINPGDMALILGSSTCHMVQSPIPVFGSGVWGPFDEAILPGNWTLEGGQTATGSILNWYKENFAGREEYEAEKTGRSPYSILDAKAAEVTPGSEGLIVLDYWQGSRSPVRDPQARGLILGLNLKHNSGHIFRAIMEGTAYGTRHIIDSLAGKKVNVAHLMAGGGGTKSSLWLQIHADVTGLPVTVPQESDSMALGAAMCAAVGAGVYPDLTKAVENMVTMKKVIKPNPASKAVYDYYFRKYLEAYQSVKGIMHDILDYN